MNWKGHMVLGAAFFIIIYCLIAAIQGILWMLYPNPVIPIPTILIAIPLALYSSILPDVDIRTSIVYAITTIALVAFVWIMVVLGYLSPIMGLMAVSMCIIALLMPHHRGFLHSLMFTTLFSIGMVLLFWDWILGLITFVCMGSHLMGDYNK